MVEMLSSYLGIYLPSWPKKGRQLKKSREIAGIAPPLLVGVAGAAFSSHGSPTGQVVPSIVDARFTPHPFLG